MDELIAGSIQIDGTQNRAAEALEPLVKRVGLRERARVPLEYRTALGVWSGQPFEHDFIHPVIRQEIAARHTRHRCSARSVAKQVSGRYVWQMERRTQQ